MSCISNNSINDSGLLQHGPVFIINLTKVQDEDRNLSSLTQFNKLFITESTRSPKQSPQSQCI